MREKTPMALKEAKEEALRLRGSTASTDDEDDPNEHEHSAPNDRKTSDRLHVPSLQDTLEEDEDVVTPPTNIDTSNIFLEEKTDTGGTNNLPIAQTDPEPEQQPEKPPRKKQPQQNEQPPDKPANDTISSVPTANTTNTNQDAPSQNGVSTTETNFLSVDKPIEQRNRSPSNVSTGSSNSQKPPSKSSQQSSDTSSLHSHSESGGPRGHTLADLKKQRAQKIQDNMKAKDSTSLNSMGDEYSHHSHQSQSDSENNIIMVPSNGHDNNTTSPGRNGLHKNTNVYYVASDKPKHRFTASKAEIIGGNDSDKTSCCTIL